MKRVSLVAFTILAVLTAKAQDGQVLSAWEYKQTYTLERGSNPKTAAENLILAKQAIDEACKNEKTSLKSKTWKRKFEIYMALLQDTLPEFKPFKLTALPEALDAAKKAMTVEVDDKGRTKIFEEKDLKASLDLLATIAFYSGNKAMESKMYPVAYSSFEMAANLTKEYFNRIDTSSLKGMFYSAYNGDMKEKALEVGTTLIKLEGDPGIYGMVSRLMSDMGKKEEALQLLKEARAKYPKRADLVIDELNYYLISNDNTNGSRVLEEAIAISQQNKDNNMLKLLYFNAGVVYLKLGDKTKSMEYYKKAIESDPDYYDPYVNLASIYIEEGNDYLKTANNLPLNEEKKYKEMLELAKNKFREGGEILEKAYAVQSKQIVEAKNESTKQALVQSQQKTKKILYELYNKVGDEQKIEKYK